MSHFFTKATLTTLGSVLITAAAYLPTPWSIAAAAVGAFMGGAVLVKRPGDVKVMP